MQRREALLRTPWKTLGFFVLLGLSTGLLVMGVNLYQSMAVAQAEVSENYQTVGTITQKPDSTQMVLEDMLGNPMLFEEPSYVTTVPGDAFDGLPTL